MQYSFAKKKAPNIQEHTISVCLSCLLSVTLFWLYSKILP